MCKCISDIRTVVSLTFTSTGIRRWSYFAAEQLLVYDIVKYRWCENVGRFHKSNNIMYECFFLMLCSLSSVCVCVCVCVCRLFDLVSSSSAGLLWISKKKLGTRSVTILNARTSDPQVCHRISKKKYSKALFYKPLHFILISWI